MAYQAGQRRARRTSRPRPASAPLHNWIDFSLTRYVLAGCPGAVPCPPRARPRLTEPPLSGTRWQSANRKHSTRRAGSYASTHVTCTRVSLAEAVTDLRQQASVFPVCLEGAGLKVFVSGSSPSRGGRRTTWNCMCNLWMGVCARACTRFPCLQGKDPLLSSDSKRDPWHDD